MDLWIASGILAIFRTPSYHLSNKLLLCRLVCGECAEESYELALAICVRLGLALVEYIE